MLNKHDAAVQQAVEHGGGHHRVIEDLAPRAHAQMGGQHGRELPPIDRTPLQP